MSSGTPMKAASSPSADAATGSRIIVAMPPKRGISLPESGWFFGIAAPSGPPAAQPLQRQQQGGREQRQQRGDGGDRRRDVLADAVEHLARQGQLLGAGEEQGDDDL